MKALSDYLYYHEDGPPVIDIYCGDCLSIMPLLPKVDLVVTDPPFGIDFKYHEYKDDPEKYEALMKKLIPLLQSLVNDGGFIFCWQAMKQSHNWHKWFPEEFRIFAGIKNFCQFRPTAVQYSWDPVIFFPVGKGAGKAIAGMRDYHIGNTAKFVAEESIGHPCPRPIDTVKYITSLFPDSKSVLDPFLGSGTTLVACKELKRNGIGIEINEKYCEIARKRLVNTQVPFL